MAATFTNLGYDCTVVPNADVGAHLYGIPNRTRRIIEVEPLTGLNCIIDHVAEHVRAREFPNIVSTGFIGLGARRR